MILIQPGYCDLAVLINLPLPQLSILQELPVPAHPELSPADPRAQPAPAFTTQHTALPLSPTFLLSLDYKPTPEKCEMQKASGKGCMPSWKGTSCLGVIPSYGEGIAAPRATGRLRRREKFDLNL